MVLTTKMKIFISILFVYTSISFLLPNGANTMQGSIMSLTMALVDAKTIRIDNFFIHQGGDLAFYNGHFYSGMAPGLSFLLIPHYLILKHFINDPNLLMQFFASSSTILCIAFSLTFLYALLKDFGSSEKEAASLTFLCAFGSLFLVYGSSLEERTMATAAIIIVFYFIEHYRFNLHEKSILLPMGVGFLLGVIPSFNYASAMLVPIFAAYFLYTVFQANGTTFRKYSRLVCFFLGLSASLCLLAAYNYHAFGAWYHTSYSFRLGPENALVAEGVGGFTYPKIRILIELLFLPYKGLLFFMPIYLLAFVSLFNKTKKNIEFILTALCMLMFILFNAGLKGWAGESCFGPRLLTESIPFAIILAAPVIKKYRMLYYAIFFYSVVVNVAGIGARWSENSVSPYLGKILIFVAANGFVGIHMTFFYTLALMIALFGVAAILYEFRISLLLVELRNEIRTKLLGAVLKILGLATILSVICVVFNRWYPMSFTRFWINLFLMLFVGAIFRRVIFKKMIQID